MKHIPNSNYFLILLAAAAGLILSTCSSGSNQPIDPTYVINFAQGTFPTSVTNFSDANSEYDDYNVALPPMITMSFPLSFSSNRATHGGTFDFVGVQVLISFNQYDGYFYLSGYPQTSELAYLNTPANEFGPYIMNLPDGRKIYLYASDQTGNLDIYFTDPVTGQPHPAAMLNSSYDDAYPTFGPDNAIYFTSNREGNFHIYRAEIPEGADIPTWLATATTATITRMDVLNSTGNDKCPSINGNLMVFTSDRTGGYGGFDLWYSTHGLDGWSTPVNLGPSINTAYDEYRPEVVYAPNFTNDLMFFSSNRPGGKGGFDLYYAGIPKLTSLSAESPWF